jgi:hypothetical protein
MAKLVNNNIKDPGYSKESLLTLLKQTDANSLPRIRRITDGYVIFEGSIRIKLDKRNNYYYNVIVFISLDSDLLKKKGDIIAAYPSMINENNTIINYSHLGP